VERDLAQLVGVPLAEVTSLAVGVNHLTWLFDLRWRGESLWPAVKARAAQESGRPIADASLRQFLAEHPQPAGARFKAGNAPFSFELLETYGAYPAVHDRHVTEFFPQRFPGGRYYGRTLGVDVFSVEQTIARGDAIYEQMRAQAAGKAPLDAGLFQRAAGEHEQLVEIMLCMEQDGRRIFSANLPNRGAVPNLPDDAVLEMPCVATAAGFRAVQALDFPDLLAELMKQKIAAQAITVEAALRGSRALFVEALLADGSLADKATAEKLADDLLTAHRQYLPQFN
jgi:alpha-galactosidase